MPPSPGDLFEVPTAIQVDWDQTDIETANDRVIKRKHETRQIIQERYPFLNDRQIEFVGVLEDAINDAIPEIKLPKLLISGKLSKSANFFSLLKLPFLTFLVNVSAAVGVVFSNHPTLGKVYPSIVTFLSFVASAPSIKGRYDTYYETVISQIDSVKKRVKPAIDEVEARATGLVTLARTNLDRFLHSIQKELDQVKKAKLIVQQLKSDAQIPDVSDLQGYLDGSEAQIRSSISDTKANLNFDQFLPWILSSKRRYNIGIVLPLLIVILGVQFFATWQVERVLEPTENRWDPVVVACQTFLIAIAQIALSCFVTRMTRIINFVNRTIKSLNEKANDLLKNKAGEVFHCILDNAMMHVRKRVLQIVLHLHQTQRLVLGVQGKAHEIKDKVDYAKDTALYIENAIQDITQIETHETSSWIRRVGSVWQTIVEKIDHLTAGLINCTGFVESSDSKP